MSAIGFLIWTVLIRYCSISFPALPMWLWVEGKAVKYSSRQSARRRRKLGVHMDLSHGIHFPWMYGQVWSRGPVEYAISQLQIIRSGLHLVTYLDVGNFYNKSTETTLHEICVQVFPRFLDSSKPSQSLSLIYKLAWLSGIRESEENLLETSCKVAPVTKVVHIFWWSHNNRKQLASGHEHWCDISCDIPIGSPLCP